MSRRFVDMRVIRDRMDRKDDRFGRELQARLPFLRPEAVPFVEVTIVRAPEAVGPVVDVAIAIAPVKIDGAK
jgi:hypothetical protein